ncbi:MAG TPA: HAD hydrolase-like protein, partial [Rectinemataceae bacterium]|nr:HAD hydrolase-like protein [Rectinemataceae bacterium]
LRKADIIRYGLGKCPPLPGSAIVMVGDRKHDVIGAKEAGVDSIGVLYGYGSHAEMEACSPDHVVASVDALKRFFLENQDSPTL